MRMLKNNLGYPRIGSQRQLKKACESYWAGKISQTDLLNEAWKIKVSNWTVQKEAGIDLIPFNDFSFYDHVLDLSLLLGVVPERFAPLNELADVTETDLYFAMARGYQNNGFDIKALEMTKWFDTNYHYLVPEFYADQEFKIASERIFNDYNYGLQITGEQLKPVLVGPVSYLLLGKEKQRNGEVSSFNRINLIDKLVPVYVEVINRLRDAGATWIQLDEPCLCLDLNEQERKAFAYAYKQISDACKDVNILLATYFDHLDDNISLASSLPVKALHIDLKRAPEQLPAVLNEIADKEIILSIGVIDGRNVWKNNYSTSLDLIQKAVAALGEQRVMIAPSCSLLHTPCDLDLETELEPEIKNWMAFAKQKLQELKDLALIFEGDGESLLLENVETINSRKSSALINNASVKNALAAITPNFSKRKSAFPKRQSLQEEKYKLPLLPTTTIGSFPQTDDIRKLRALYKKNEISLHEYEETLRKATIEAIRLQEDIGLDVLVHGEFERNDMVEYFGEQLAGFAFTKNGWVQSYGSRCVKPPVIFGDISRPNDMTVKWSEFAQANTKLPVKGMLTGPVTILQWSFVRDDQPRRDTTFQIALAIREEVLALEKAGIGIIQIDEPAIREGLPLRKKHQSNYLQWAVEAFRISSSGVADETQIHTHMCYSEFNDIIKNVADMDADVITIETSRSQMELLDAFANFKYPNEIGPGVYDIHSPSVPTEDEMVHLLEKASTFIPLRNLWVNPDCGLKTRKWEETKQALVNMVNAAHKLREKVAVEAIV